MNILAVDTSGNVCSAAVLHDERIVSEIYVDHTKTHSEMLGPMVDSCLSLAGLDIRQIDLLSCVTGPGSFTGLRIGTGLIKAFAHASGKPTVGVNTLDALAMNVFGTDEIVCPVIDARRGDVYTATYHGGKRLSDIRAIQLDQVLLELQGQEAVFLGDAAVVFRQNIEASSASFRIAPAGVVLQRAGSAGLCAFRSYALGQTQDAYALEPYYLRQTQAERIFQARQS